MIGLTVLGSGSRGNALVLQNRDECLLIDAGFSFREIRRRLEAAEIPEECIRAVIISHEHTDHVKGLKTLGRHWDVPIYCNRLTGETLRERGLGVGKLHLFHAGSSFRVGDFYVDPFSIPHDAIDPVGFSVQCNNVKVGIATDLGYASKLVTHHLCRSDILVLESNHDLGLLQNSGRPWSVKQRIMSRHGHLSNDASISLLGEIMDARTRHVLLAHASQDCNRYELVEETMSSFLNDIGRSDVGMQVARQDEGLRTLWAEGFDLKEAPAETPDFQ